MNLGAVLTALQSLGTVIETTFNTAENAVGQFAQRAGKVIGLLADMAGHFDTLKSVVESSMTAFANWSFLDKFIQAEKETESQLVKLKTSMQDVTGAVNEYQRAVRFAAETPFAVNQVVSAAAMLRTFEFNPFEKLEKDSRNLMQVLGDMAGAMGMQISEAAHALNRAAVGEWEYLQNRWQISAKMIPALKGLTSGTKEYKEAIVQFLAEQGRFNNGMDLSAKTITGLSSNIQDLFSNLLTVIGGVLDAENVLKGMTFYDRVRENLLVMYRLVSDESPLTAFKRIASDVSRVEESLAKNTEKLGKVRKKDDLDKLNAEKLILEAKKRDLEIEMRRTRQRFEDRSFIPLDKSLYAASANSEASQVTKSALQLLREANLDNARPEDQRDFLIRQGVDPNALISQYEKLQTAARMLGQVMGSAYTLLADQIVKFGAFLTNKFLDGANKLLDKVFKGALSIKNMVDKDVDATATRILKGTKEYTKVVSDYLKISADVTSEKYEEMEKQIRQTLLGSEDLLTKRIMLFSVVLGLITEFIKLKFEEIVDNNPLLSLLRDLFDTIVEDLPSALNVLKNAFKNFFKENENLLNSFFPMLSETTLKVQELGSELRGEAEAGGGAITKNITESLNMAVGAMGMMIMKTMMWEKAMIGVNNVMLGISKWVLGFLGAIADIIRIVIGTLFEFGQILASPLDTITGRRRTNFPDFNFKYAAGIFNTFQQQQDINDIMMDAMPSQSEMYEQFNRFSNMLSSKRGMDTQYTSAQARADSDRYRKEKERTEELRKEYEDYIKSYNASSKKRQVESPNRRGLFNTYKVDLVPFDQFRDILEDPDENRRKLRIQSRMPAYNKDFAPSGSDSGSWDKGSFYLPKPMNNTATPPLLEKLNTLTQDNRQASADTLGSNKTINFIMNNPSIVDEKTARRLLKDAYDMSEFTLGLS